MDEYIAVDMEEFFARLGIRIFTEFVLHPGEVGVAEQVEVIPSIGDAFEYPGVAVAEDELAPYLHDVHIGIDEEDGSVRLAMSLPVADGFVGVSVFEGELAFRNLQQVVEAIVATVSEEVIPRVFRAPGGIVM